MGLTTWRGALPTKQEAEIAKNYLLEEEVYMLNRIVNLYLDFAELQARSHVPMYMKDWIKYQNQPPLYVFLSLCRKNVAPFATIPPNINHKNKNYQSSKLYLFVFMSKD